MRNQLATAPLPTDGRRRTSVADRVHMMDRLAETYSYL